jgi:hypothetical protein
MQSSSSIQLQAKLTISTYQNYQAKPTTPKISTSQAHGHGWLGWLVAVSDAEPNRYLAETVCNNESALRMLQARVGPTRQTSRPRGPRKMRTIKLQLTLLPLTNAATGRMAAASSGTSLWTPS